MLATGRALRRDPLTVLTTAFADGAGSVRLCPRRVYVADPFAAKEILGNRDANYVEHSDFFHVRQGTFGPRSAQLEIARASRLLLRRRLDEGAATLPALVDRVLGSISRWPDAGNALLYRHLGSALLHDGAPSDLRATIDQVVLRAVLAGARDRYSAMARARFRRRVMRELCTYLESRRAAPAGAATLLDVVTMAGAGAPARELAEVFLSFLFAIAGSTGFLLGWSVYLMGTSSGGAAEPALVVREALRLWPVAWLFGRRPAHGHDVAGTQVTPADDVLVCSYLVHRHPAHWPDPHEFRPQRWVDPDHSAFIPFGWGTHACTGAASAIRIVEDILRVLAAGGGFSVAAQGSHPHAGPALAPPPFTMRRPGD
jgi:cytochrome P450